MENSIIGKYPVIIDGETCGELSIANVGLMTEFDVLCRDCGTVLRVSVYGDDGEGYLGVMMPEAGMLRLKKKLSRAAIADFPDTITHAGPAGFAAAAVPRVQVDAIVQTAEPSVPIIMAVSAAEAISMGILPDVELDGNATSETANIDLEATVKAADADNEPIIETADIDDETSVETMTMLGESSSAAVTVWSPSPNPWSMFSNTSAKMALRSVRGALASTTDGKSYLAIPGDGTQDFLGDFRVIETRAIEGISYTIVETDSET